MPSRFANRRNSRFHHVIASLTRFESQTVLGGRVGTAAEPLVAAAEPSVVNTADLRGGHGVLDMAIRSNLCVDECSCRESYAGRFSRIASTLRHSAAPKLRDRMMAAQWR